MPGTQERIAGLIDGRRTLGAIAELTAAPGEIPDEALTDVLAFVETLWHQDYLAMELPPTS